MFNLAAELISSVFWCFGALVFLPKSLYEVRYKVSNSSNEDVYSCPPPLKNKIPPHTLLTKIWLGTCHNLFLGPKKMKSALQAYVLHSTCIHSTHQTCLMYVNHVVFSLNYCVLEVLPFYSTQLWWGSPT